MITVAYGVNDVIGRRVLWADLTRLSTLTTTVPWLVGGDFNTVVDTSEVCGQSGDIRGAAEEFRDVCGIQGSLHCLCRESALPGITVAGTPGAFGSGWTAC
ncbi:UNVERIFIED_CONTAM: hypothetical protein Sradi_7066700 [Sesamum radiatum]|uniref:Endonuclease/exonuclease/phosphatase domain-containing protein n=1 Tax=Sesamum radiatum TaxID=300843 RepID=A0AAW2J5S3_SESRA